MGRNSDMLTSERIRREALRQLDDGLARCTDRLPSLRDLEAAAIAEMAAAGAAFSDEADETDDDIEPATESDS